MRSKTKYPYFILKINKLKLVKGFNSLIRSELFVKLLFGFLDKK